MPRKLSNDWRGMSLYLNLGEFSVVNFVFKNNVRQVQNSGLRYGVKIIKIIRVMCYIHIQK